MRTTNFFGQSLKMVLLALLMPAVSSFTIRDGGEIYEIYLNNKLILQQPLGKPFTVKTLSLHGATAKDQIVVHYFHCGAVGRDRTLSLMDAKGNVLKKWSYKDAPSSRSGMVIPVKDLLELEKRKHAQEFRLFYVAKEIPKGSLLAAFGFGDQSTANNLRK